MTYQEAESFLFSELQSFQEKGKVAYKGSLENILTLTQILGNPQQKFKSIHIAGTNGKGSVSHMIAAGLQANGYKVGLYTSPHYKSYRERIKINGELISEHHVAHFIEKHKADIININPSFFEITCAMAFAYFAENEVDVAVVEVGLGGRLDSTNILRPLISVITNISFDHQQILGDTLKKIAAEKAGIIKSDIPAVIGERQVETTEVFNAKAQAVNTNLSFAEDESHLSFVKKMTRTVFTFSVPAEEWSVEFESHLTSEFQKKNLVTALYTLYALRNQFHLERKKIAEGIKNIERLTYFMGRWSKMSENPTVIFDSAHNLAGVQHLVAQVKQIQYSVLRMVWGCTKEKDVDEILTLLPKDAIYYFCEAHNSRAMAVEDLERKAMAHGLNGLAFNSVKSAYQVALAEAEQEDLIIVAGSTFVIAEVL